MAPRLLAVYAHPDDESFGPAALLAKYARAGWAVYGLFFTRGQCGQTSIQPPPPPAELGRRREQDLRDAGAVIGFAEIVVLGYPDGRLAQVPPAELAARVAAAIHHFRPEVVLTFGPGGITHHPDHLAVYRAATMAFGQALRAGQSVRELYYDAVPAERARAMNLVGEPDGEPNTWIDVAATFPIKLAALRYHARHVVDAREMVARLVAEPQRVATLYRAWPPVEPGARITGLLQEAQADRQGALDRLSARSGRR